ncbi:hypothetical protein SDC9_129327 [bioreactor metagenome]|jgi:hypothetical protein|uniref:Uncharacterized protein n=1 Tax=bioreactor metagenome TaxID=1076179 RepID=A0A645CYN3_9ZZZZ
MALIREFYLFISWVIACKQRAQTINKAILEGWIDLGNKVFSK